MNYLGDFDRLYAGLVFSHRTGLDAEDTTETQPAWKTGRYVGIDVDACISGADIRLQVRYHNRVYLRSRMERFMDRVTHHLAELAAL